MTVHAVVGNVQFPACEPFRPGNVPLEHPVPRLEPMQALGLFAPEGFEIRAGALINLGTGNIRLPAEVVGGRENPVLLQQSCKLILLSRYGVCHGSTSRHWLLDLSQL